MPTNQWLLHFAVNELVNLATGACLYVAKMITFGYKSSLRIEKTGVDRVTCIAALQHVWAKLCCSFL